MNASQIQSAPPLKRHSVYNSTFWLAYAANVALVTANALTFRFAELIAFLGGSEKIAGFVVSVGVVGALVVRIGLGQAIDRFGTRRLWMLSSLLFLIGCIVFLVCRHLSWEICAARIAFSAGLAGMFTCSIVHIQNRVPHHRRTEVIGSLGSSGFVGIVIGSLLGDAIFNALPAGDGKFVALFGGATGLGVLYLALVARLTRRDVHVPPYETPAAHRLLFRYWPGYSVLAALMMGVGFTVITVFLTRFTTYLQTAGSDVNGIGTFFTGYASSAFVFRLATRRWSLSVGRHRMILAGLAGHCVGHCLLPFVTSDWHFIVPSIACGWGHALLFPAVISLGAGAFPQEYRGTGTTLVLGFTEVGAMISAPALGGIVDHFGSLYGQQVGFTAMFLTSSATALVIGIVYALTAARTTDNDGKHEIPLAEMKIDQQEADVSRNNGELPALVDKPQLAHNNNGESPQDEAVILTQRCKDSRRVAK